jgi:hypothetical protein
VTIDRWRNNDLEFVGDSANLEVEMGGGVGILGGGWLNSHDRVRI